MSPQSGVTQRDLNVKEAWAQGYTGRGIVVSILDDGIEKNHPDLAGNYVSRWRWGRSAPRGGVRGSPALPAWPGYPRQRSCLSQDPGASFDVNDQDPDPQPRYTQMNDNR